MDIRWITKNELYDLFKDKTFQKEVDENKFKYLIPQYLGEDEIIAAFVDQKMVGILQLAKMPRADKLYAMKYVTVHPDFRGQGVAKALLKEMVSHVSGISGASLELSTYEPEGEVLIPTVRELALSHPELSLKHRTWGGPYQDAKYDFLKNDMEVIVNDPHQNIQGQGTIMYFCEYSEPLKVMVKIKDQAVEVEPKYLSLA